MRCSLSDLRLILSAFFLLVLSGCFITSGDLEDEISSIMNSQFSATGSDLTLAVCGWQPSENLKVQVLKAKTDPYSSGGTGLGSAYIKGNGQHFSCEGEISFHYSEAYMGGHGSGYNSLKIELINRESEVPASISNNPDAKKISIDENISGRLSDSSRFLPDGSHADWYYIDINGKEPAIKVLIQSDNKKINPRCYIYQGMKFISKDVDSGFRINQGRVIIMISAGKDMCGYSLKVINLTDSDKSILKR